VHCRYPIIHRSRNASLSLALSSTLERARVLDLDGELLGGYNVRVNRVGYQKIAGPSLGFLVRHAGLLKEAIDESPYSVAFRFAPPAATALRNGSRAIGAVEIEPAIWRLGRRLHPERSYDSPRVSGQLTDRRAFLKP
jgi:hypothetical protein